MPDIRNLQTLDILTSLTFGGSVVASICVFATLQTINRWRLESVQKSALAVIDEINTLDRRKKFRGGENAYWLEYFNRLDEKSERQVHGATPFSLFSESWDKFHGGLVYEHAYIAAISVLVACSLSLLLDTVDPFKRKMGLVMYMTYNTAFFTAFAIISSVWVWWMLTYMRRPSVGLAWIVQSAGYHRGFSPATHLIDLPGDYHYLAMTGIGAQVLALLLLTQKPVFVLWVIWAFPGQEMLLKWFIICRLMYHCLRGLRILSFSNVCFGKEMQKRRDLIAVLTTLRGLGLQG